MESSKPLKQKTLPKRFVGFNPWYAYLIWAVLFQQRIPLRNKKL